MNISATLGYRGQGLQVHAGSAKAANGKNFFFFFFLLFYNDVKMRM